MDRARGIDVIAVGLIVLLIAELVGALIGQRLFWFHGGEVVHAMRSPFVPSVIIATVVVFAVEGLIRRRDEVAMLTRVVAMLIVGVGLPIAAVVASMTGVISRAHPVG